jgi:outer membrane protein assembly factor BamB
VLSPSTVSGLGLDWSVSGGSASSPAVVDGVVYVGDANGAVHALNAATGAEMWSYNTGDIVDSSPAVVNGVVYIPSEIGKV